MPCPALFPLPATLPSGVGPRALHRACLFREALPGPTWAVLGDPLPPPQNLPPCWRHLKTAKSSASWPTGLLPSLPTPAHPSLYCPLLNHSGSFRTAQERGCDPLLASRAFSRIPTCPQPCLLPTFLILYVPLPLLGCLVLSFPPQANPTVSPGLRTPPPGSPLTCATVGEWQQCPFLLLFLSTTFTFQCW